MKKAAKWLLCINLLAWTLLAVQVLTVNMEQRVAQNTVPVQNGGRCSEKEGSTDF